MAISVVSRLSGVDSTGATGNVALAYTSNTAGNTLIAKITSLATLTSSLTINDTNTNTWTLVLDYPTGGDAHQRVWAAYNCKVSAGANTVTIQDGNNSSAAAIYEVSGLASSQAFDKSATGVNAASTTPSSGATAVTTNNNELVLVMMHDDGSTTGTVSLGTGYSNLLVPTPTNGLVTGFEEKIISSAAAQTGAFNNTASNGTAVVTTVTFSDTLIVALPTVTTQSASSIAKTTATANGNVTNTGGATNDHQGVVYDTVTHTLPGNVVPGSSGYASSVDSSGSFSAGAFTESLTGLTKNTTYFYRAYTHNSVGYSYGSEVSFALVTSVPLVDALSDTNIGFTDNITTFADDKLLLEDGVSYLLLEDGSSRLVLNYNYPQSDSVSFNIPSGAGLANSTVYYWRVRQKLVNGSYGPWSEIRSFTTVSGGGMVTNSNFFQFMRH